MHTKKDSHQFQMTRENLGGDLLFAIVVGPVLVGHALMHVVGWFTRLFIGRP